MAVFISLANVSKILLIFKTPAFIYGFSIFNLIFLLIILLFSLKSFQWYHKGGLSFVLLLMFVTYCWRGLCSHCSYFKTPCFHYLITLKSGFSFGVLCFLWPIVILSETKDIKPYHLYLYIFIIKTMNSRLELKFTRYIYYINISYKYILLFFAKWII